MSPVRATYMIRLYGFIVTILSLLTRFQVADGFCPSIDMVERWQAQCLATSDSRIYAMDHPKNDNSSNSEPLHCGDAGFNKDCPVPPRQQRRRDFIQSTATTAAAVALALSNSQSAVAITEQATLEKSKYLVSNPPTPRELYWPAGKVAFSLLPLAGTYTRRKSVETTIIPNLMWTHDQIQGIVNVNVPVRQTVVKLSGGGLLVYNPVAPTPELVQMMRQLEAKHGPIKHIVFGTVALEHKGTLGPFASYFKYATVWLMPGQWSFPANLPVEFLGVQQLRGRTLKMIPISSDTKSDDLPEWTRDFDYEALGPFKFKSVGGFAELALYHRSSRTLLVTDTVCSITKEPPAILQEDPRALLFHSRDYATQEIVTDTPQQREKGWTRMIQFGLVFFPAQITVNYDLVKVIEDASNVPTNLRNLGDGAIPGSTLYPWSWNDGQDLTHFEAISQNGKLFCPPILTKLILDREPKATLEWVDRVSTRFADMERIVPCHLNNDIMRNNNGDLAREFYNAFEPLRSTPENPKPQRPLATDLALLQKASDLLTRYGIVGPSLVCDGEPAREVGRFASE